MLVDYGSDDEDGVSAEPHPHQSAARKRPVKFSVSLPESSHQADDDEPPAKKARNGAGKSSLLNLLPAPKSSSATLTERVLGASSAGGLVFKTANQGSAVAAHSSSFPSVLSNSNAADPVPPFQTTGANPFGLTSAASSSDSRSAVSSDFSISSAPQVPDFEIPEPKEDDPYPGYYRLPSGKWAQYDTEYYQSFWKQKQNEWEAQFASPEKGFDGAEDTAADISAADQLDHGKVLREEKKAITKNAGTGPSKPNMNIEAPKIGSRARYRHQLTALLTEAYDRREELEEKIAQARRNRKEAGNKYGF